MGESHEFGRSAEAAAADLLTRAGWRVVARNWRWKHKELDLVARRGRLVAFVEVRARRTDRHGHPLESITRTKRRDLEAAAQGWILQFGRPLDEYRFDVIWLLPGRGGAVIQHVEGAWWLGS